MVNSCLRCHERKEIRQTNNPDNKVVRYRRALRSLSKHRIDLRAGSSFCVVCAEELSSWLESPRGLHFKGR
jgi:hypothetical protein